jgi:hypothetical protein
MAQYNLFWGNIGAESYTDLDDLAEALSLLPANVTAMNTINAAGGVKCWWLPEYDQRYAYKAGCAVIARSVCVRYAVGDYSDIPAGAQTTGVEVGGEEYICYTDTEASGSVELGLFNGYQDSTPKIKLIADEFKGVAEFNISVAALGLMDSEPQEAFLKTNDVAIDEKYLYTKFFLGKFSNMVANQYMFYRATAEFGGSNKLDTHADRVLLSNRGKIEVTSLGANNYVTILVPNVSGWSYTITLQRTQRTLTNGKVYQLFVGSADDAAAVNTLISSIYFEQSVSYTYKNECNDVPVRWFNTEGGLNCYLFPYRQILKIATKTTKTAQHTHRNGEPLIVPELVPYELEHSRLLDLGEDNVSVSLAEFLKTLAYSQYIQYKFDYHNTDWRRCSVEKFDLKQETDKAALNYEIELRIPDLNTLF